jgi:ABC-type enterochelin transport system permease subunit
MEQLPGILQRLEATNELMAYAVAFVGVLTFLGIVITGLTLYRSTVEHRKIMRDIEGVGHYLFKKMGPVELP